MKAKADEIMSMMYMEFGNLLLEFDCHEDAARFLSKSLGLAEKQGDTHGVRRALQSMGKVLLRQGKFRVAELFFNRCLDMHEPGNPGYDILPLLGLIELYRFTGRYEKAEDKVAAAENKLMDNKPMSPYILAAASGLYIDTGRFRKAIDQINKAMTQEEHESKGEIWIELLSRRGWAYHKIGETAKAKESFDMALALAKTKDVPYRESTVYSLLSMAESESGKEQALDHARLAVEKAVAVNSELCLTLAAEAMAGALNKKGRHEQGMEYSKYSLMVANKIGQQQDICASLLAIAHSHIAAGRYDDALVYGYQVLCFANSKFAPQRNQALLIIARAHAHRGLGEDAENLARAVFEWGEETGAEHIKNEARILLDKLVS